MNEEKKKPRVLYHYCGVQTFYNIIKNRSIWLSDLSKTNDGKELVWLKEIVKREARRKINKRVREIREEKNSVETREKEKYEGEILGWRFVKTFLKYVDRDDIECWGFCLSEKDDNLGQWRGYGDGGAGISIGFKYDELCDMIRPKKDIYISMPDLTIGKVRYVADEIDSFLERDAKRIAEDQDKLIEEIWEITQNKTLQKTEKRQKNALSSYAKEIFVEEMVAKTRAPFYKMDAFEEEAEWRIVYSIPRNQFSREAIERQWPSGLKFNGFAFNDSTFVSHIDVQFEKMENVIESVTIGPKCKLTEQDIELILRWNGVYSDSIEIKKSGASYR